MANVKSICTLLIPTYNRPLFLKRLLSYYSENKTELSILIGDSSSDSNKVHNKNIVESFPNLNILYLDKYPQKFNPINKFAEMAASLKTKYSVFCADDDFITLNGIKKSIEFLEKNPDYVCAQGNYISFKFNSENNNFFWKQNYLHQKSITSSDPKQRLTLHMSNYMHTFYSVHKTKILKKSFEDVPKYTDDYRFGELLQSMLTLIYGKMKKLDIFYAARESIIDSGGKTSPTILDYIKEGAYEEKYEKFRKCLAIHLSKKADIDFNEAAKIVENAWQIYLDNRILKKGKKLFSTKMSEILNGLNLPDWANNNIREIYKKLISQPINKSKWNKNIPNPKYYKDLKITREHVLSDNNQKLSGNNEKEDNNQK